MAKHYYFLIAMHKNYITTNIVLTSEMTAPVSPVLPILKDFLKV
jgi:hypothetical protein